MQKIIGAKNLGGNSLSFFSTNFNVEKNQNIVVEVDDFQTICVVTETEPKISKPAEEFGKVVRIATDGDIAKFNSLKEKARRELPIFKKKSLELGLMMKFVSAEYSLDGSKILIIFSSEERVDFRQFLKELASMLKTRIELKQIGQRDEVKMLGGVGPCGQPCCCARFLKDFEHVTVKMAKVQSLSLSPTKINGVCGRLMCCLGYESQMYEEKLAKMPKVNSEVETPNGRGTVVYNDILRERVSVKRKADGDTLVIEEFELYDIVGFGEKPKEENNQNPKNEIKKEQNQKNKENKEQSEQQKENNKDFEQKNKNQDRPFNKNFNKKGKNKFFKEKNKN